MGQRKRKRKRKAKRKSKAEDIPSDVLPEILSRVPYRSLCRFKCVSRAWLALCSDPAVRKRSPQTLSGFFSHRPGSIDFLNLSGRGRPMVDPSLRFVHGYQQLDLLDCCVGILLCRGLFQKNQDRADYVVCNPATEEVWAAIAMPEALLGHGKDAILCFHPAIPGRRFTLFVVIHASIDVLQVYSSNTGEWTSLQSPWGGAIFHDRSDIFQHSENVQSQHVFFNGTLHLPAINSVRTTEMERNFIVTLDMDGTTWGTMPLPPRDLCPLSLIGHSQGHLYGIHMDDKVRGNHLQISVSALEDCDSGKEWTLKHTASFLELLGGPSDGTKEWNINKFVTIHPERNLIFFSAKGEPGKAPMPYYMDSERDKALMSYDMDNEKLHVIGTLEDDRFDVRTLVPYIPCFME